MSLDLITIDIAKCRPGSRPAYTGIGSRQTPEHILRQMTDIAEHLRERGYTLRSGGADRADAAFESGAGEQKEIYLPWKDFNGNASPLFEPSLDAFNMAAQYHPGWNYLTRAARLLMARNCHQVLGRNLKTPSTFVVCWTPDAADGIEILTSEKTGGTGQAIRIAVNRNIPVLNLAKLESTSTCTSGLF